MIGDIRLRNRGNQARIRTAATERSERCVADRGLDTTFGDQLFGLLDDFRRHRLRAVFRRVENVFITARGELSGYKIDSYAITWQDFLDLFEKRFIAERELISHVLRQSFVIQLPWLARGLCHGF